MYKINENQLDSNQLAIKSRGINWQNFLIVSSFHVLAVGALFFFSWQNLAVLLILHWLTESLGIGIGYHRLLTHRGFTTPKALEYFLTVLGSFAIQDGAVKWVTTHRIHHAFTDLDGDPHSTRESFYWAHLGWIITGRAQEHDKNTCARYVPDLMKDSFHVLFARYYYVSSIILGIGLFFLGGWGMLFWGIFLRTVVGWHSTWIVNSITHYWGSRRFETRDDSTNNGLVALFSFGEGWHNNHHAHPTSARHGLRWFEFDQNWLTIKLFEKLGLVKQLKVYQLKTRDNS